VNISDADKTRMIGLPYGVKPFSSDTGTSRTDRRTDGPDRQTELRVSLLTRDKNYIKYILLRREKVPVRRIGAYRNKKALSV